MRGGEVRGSITEKNNNFTRTLSCLPKGTFGTYPKSRYQISIFYSI